MSPLDVVSEGLEGAGALLDRVDPERVTELVSELAAADVAALVASSSEALGEQVATAIEHGRRMDRTARIALIAGVALLVGGGVFWVRRRKQRRDADDGSTVTAA